MDIVYGRKDNGISKDGDTSLSIILSEIPNLWDAFDVTVTSVA